MSEPPPDRPNLPLAGLVVLDLGQIYQGPYATLLMAKAGAVVIKIEPPGGRAHPCPHPSRPPGRDPACDAERQQARRDARPQGAGRRWAAPAHGGARRRAAGEFRAGGDGPARRRLDRLARRQPAPGVRVGLRLRPVRSGSRQLGDGSDRASHLRGDERDRLPGRARRPRPGRRWSISWAASTSTRACSPPSTNATSPARAGWWRWRCRRRCIPRWRQHSASSTNRGAPSRRAPATGTAAWRARHTTFIRRRTATSPSPVSWKRIGPRWPPPWDGRSLPKIPASAATRAGWRTWTRPTPRAGMDRHPAQGRDPCPGQAPPHPLRPSARPFGSDDRSAHARARRLAVDRSSRSSAGSWLPTARSFARRCGRAGRTKPGSGPARPGGLWRLARPHRRGDRVLARCRGAQAAGLVGLSAAALTRLGAIAGRSGRH